MLIGSFDVDHCGQRVAKIVSRSMLIGTRLKKIAILNRPLITYDLVGALESLSRPQPHLSGVGIFMIAIISQVKLHIIESAWLAPRIAWIV